MWLVKETDFGKAEPTIELHEEQKKEKEKKHGVLMELLKSVDARSDAQVSCCKEKVFRFHLKDNKYFQANSLRKEVIWLCL
jgi:hypothetical protein